MKHQCAAISHATKCDKMWYRILSHWYRILLHFIACDIAFCRKLKNTFFSTTVWTSENGMKFSGGTENKSDVFLHVIRKRIFLSAQFFVFAQKRNEKGGWDSSLKCFFLEAIVSLSFRRFYRVGCARANSKREFRVEIFCFTFHTHYVGIKICMRTSFYVKRAVTLVLQHLYVPVMGDCQNWDKIYTPFI